MNVCNCYFVNSFFCPPPNLPVLVLRSRIEESCIHLEKHDMLDLN